MAHADNLNRTQMTRLKRSPAWWRAFAVLASHPIGFVRQTAIEELALEEAGESLPFILLRTTDWVEPEDLLRLLANQGWQTIVKRKKPRARSLI